MEDPKKYQNQINGLQRENDQLKKEAAENDRNDSWSQAYKCNMCNNNVNYAFILPFIKAQGLCPDCWHKEDL